MEEWREVPGRPGYLVSDQGRAAKLMTAKHKSRYIQFSVPKPGGGRYRDYLHNWVLWAFQGPRPEGLLARHLDDDPDNNRADNLLWGTRSENQHDIYANGIRTHKTHCKHGHALEGENLTPDRHCRTCVRARAKVHRLKAVI